MLDLFREELRTHLLVVGGADTEATLESLRQIRGAARIMKCGAVEEAAVAMTAALTAARGRPALPDPLAGWLRFTVATLAWMVLEITHQSWPDFNDGAIWYDLGDWRAVRIDAGGWRVVDDPPVLFRHLAHQRAQVEPVQGFVVDGKRIPAWSKHVGLSLRISLEQRLFHRWPVFGSILICATDDCRWQWRPTPPSSPRPSP